MELLACQDGGVGNYLVAHFVACPEAMTLSRFDPDPFQAKLANKA